MTAFERILVYTRGASADDPALARAFAIAKRWGGHITVLDVFAELPAGMEPLLASLELSDASEEAERERRGELERIARQLHSHGVRVETDLRWGRPAVEIVTEAVRHRHDVVVLEDDRPHGMHGPTRVILRECPAPVWVVKSAPHVPPVRVLAAVAPDSDTPSPLDRRILRVASAACETMSAELRVVHAWQPLDEAIEWLPDGMRLRAEKGRALEEARARHGRWLTDLVGLELPRHPRERTHLVEGAPADAVLKQADEVGADLIVLGTARTPEHPGMYVGSTAESIIERTPVSVLAVKPDGFVSPVV